MRLNPEPENTHIQRSCSEAREERHFESSRIQNIRKGEKHSIQHGEQQSVRCGSGTEKEAQEKIYNRTNVSDRVIEWEQKS